MTSAPRLTADLILTGGKIVTLGIRVGSFGPRALDYFEKAARIAPISDQRWILEHVGMFSPDDVRRIRDLGLVLQALTSRWIEDDGDRLLATYGDAGADQVLPMRDLINAGVHVALATDNVPPTMFASLSHVVRRLTASGRKIGERHTLSRMEALASASREGAFLTFEEQLKGTLEAGKLADFAILSEDLLTVAEERIEGIVAEVTVTGGRVVHDRSDGDATGLTPFLPAPHSQCRP